MSDLIKLSFVDKSVKIKKIDDKVTKASIVSGFKFNLFDRGFDRYGFSDLPGVVVGILYELGYKKDYNLGMWVTKTTGISSCNDGDEYDEVRGRRIALSRAKQKAYEKAVKVTSTISQLFMGVVNLMDNTSILLNDYYMIEEDSIENVIETGVSRPVETLKN